MIQISTCNISRHKDLFQVADHMVRLQNIADFKAKPLLKDGGIVELSVSTFEFPKKRSVSISIRQSSQDSRVFIIFKICSKGSLDYSPENNLVKEEWKLNMCEKNVRRTSRSRISIKNHKQKLCV